METEPAEVAFPGLNGRIAFVGERTTGVGVDNPTGDSENFTMKPDGPGLTQLTSNTAQDSTPNWSPDGKQIVFLSNRVGNSEIYRMRINGSLQTLISNNPARDSEPDWQPLNKLRR